MSRYSLRGESDEQGSPLLGISSLEYLFCQAKYEFVNEVTHKEELKSEAEKSRFKNESLGMAVLQLSHYAMQTNKKLQETAEKFHHCIPKSFAKQISKDNILTKYRMKRIFTNFIQTFQQHTVDKGKLSPQEIMYKYISTLEHLVPRFGTETFSVCHLELQKDEQDNGFSESTGSQADLNNDYKTHVTHEIMVCGVGGIQWRECNLSFRNENTTTANQHSNELRGDSSNTWMSFCDFPEITHITMTENNVCISTDTHCMIIHMKSPREAQSFVSLLDGYYRLTADAHHYLCREVAPPRAVLSEANGLHGPIQEEFALMKLKREAAEEGVFLVRWSAIDYHRLLLVVMGQNKSGSATTHKQFRIELKGSMFCLEGWGKEYSSIKELSDSLKTFVLQSGEDTFTVRKCCKPKLREISNLLILIKAKKRVEMEQQFQHVSEVRFKQIKDKEIKKDKNLGRGTRANIFSGFLVSPKEASERNEIKVVLKILDEKILDETHKNIALVFFETASFMAQVSHRHLVFVHGVAVKGTENILVEEYVEFGALDVFLRREKAHISPEWKLIVIKQLASVLSYLETKHLTHGNVCGRNVLVDRKGLEPGTVPVVKLSDPGIALSALTRQERVERIPFIAPECIESGASSGSVDQWSFGATLLEICNNGRLPMNTWKLAEKERFYQQRSRLAEPSSEKLSELIQTCLTYEPADRPSFRTVLRELTDITNPDISLHEPWDVIDSTVYHKRYMKEMDELGAGHFGKVALYRYDPSDDGTGELVAVKSLKQGDCEIVPSGWMKEIETLKSLSHDNIVKYKGCCTELGGQLVQLVMEFVPKGSLQKYVRKHKLSMPHCLLFAQQICQGMAYLHSERYIHRDLAARNVLVNDDNLIKIGDFGLSKYLPEGEDYYKVREDGESPVYWYAVECVRDNKFSFESDAWSFAVTLYEILTRCDPRESPPTKYNEMKGPDYPEMNSFVLVKMLEAQRRLPCPKNCPHEVKIIINQCWATESSNRPTFSSLVERLERIRQDLQTRNSFSLAQFC